MFCRNIDFFAVLAITVGLLGFSEASRFVRAAPMDLIRFESAAPAVQSSWKPQTCPIPARVHSHLAYFLHR